MSVDGTHGADGTKQVRGVNQDRREGKRLQLDRREFPGSTSQRVPPHKTPDGQTVEGTTSDQEHRSFNGRGGLHYAHRDAEAHRRALGSQPHPGPNKLGKR